MKHLISLISFALIILTANANIHIVTCQNNPVHFLPETFTCEVGDTIQWTWVAGNHIVGPIDPSYIPNGAAMFIAPIDVSNQFFEYVVTVPGTYNYDCHPATPHGETGSFIASSVAGIQNDFSFSKLISAFPNPSDGKFQFIIDNSLLNQNSKLEIRDFQGKLIYLSPISNAKSDIELRNFVRGNYFLEFNNGETIINKKIVIQ
jgi:plastocyanin